MSRLSQPRSREGQATSLSVRGRQPAVVVVVTALVLGLVAGMVWRVVTPLPSVEVLVGGGARFTQAEDPAFVAADGIFVLVTAIAGLLCGVVLRLVAGSARPWHPVALAISGIGAAALAWWLGATLGPGPLAEQIAAAKGPTELSAPLELRGWVAVVAWPMAALLAYAALALVLSPARSGARDL